MSSLAAERRARCAARLRRVTRRIARRSCRSAAAPTPPSGGTRRPAASSPAPTTSTSFRRGCARSTIASSPTPMPACRGPACLAPATPLRQMPTERGAALYDAVYGSPYGNDLLLDFAGELLDRERLGTAQRDRPACRSASRPTIRSATPMARTRRRCATSRCGPTATIGQLLDRSRQDGRPAAHAGRIHHRSRRRAGARDAARTIGCPAAA